MVLWPPTLEPCLWWMYEEPKNQAVHASRVYRWWVAGGFVPIPWCNQSKMNYPGGCTQKALDYVGVCAKQAEAEGGGQWEKLAVTRGAKNKPKIRMCVSSMVMVQRWNVAAMGGAPSPTRLWREEHVVEVIGHLMRLVGSSSSSDVPFFWRRINWLNIYHVMKLYIGSWVMGLSMVCMKGVCPLYTDPNRLCIFPPNCWETQQEPPPYFKPKRYLTLY